MANTTHHLAIETSTGDGAVALGRGDEPLATRDLPSKRRHNLELIPTVDHLLRDHGLTARDLAELYISLGPGSFTGLRIAVATAKMLALTLGVRVVGVPTLDVLREQHPGVMVCLNVKRGTAWSAGPGHPPALRPLEGIAATGLPLVADTIDGAMPPRPDVATLYRLGRTRAVAGGYDDPLTLTPLYIREPEAVTLWDEKQALGARD